MQSGLIQSVNSQSGFGQVNFGSRRAAAINSIYDVGKGQPYICSQQDQFVIAFLEMPPECAF